MKRHPSYLTILFGLALVGSAVVIGLIELYVRLKH